MNTADHDAILLVGEGDFSFSVALEQHLVGVDITTSCLLTEADLYKRHTNSRTNVSLLKGQGVTVLFEVDATSLASHAELKERTFHKVMFNFPHVGGKSDIRRNRRLLREFFLSAAEVIRPGGFVCVTLCKGQGGTPMDQPIRLWADSWQVVAMATYANLVLRKVEPFDAHTYSAYSATGYRSQDRHFRTDEALTYIFRKSPPVQMPLLPFKQQMAEVTADGMKFLTEVYIAEKLNMNLLGQPEHPVSIVREELMAALTSMFTVKDIGPLPLVVSEECCPAVIAETNYNGVNSEKSDAGGMDETKLSYHLTPMEGHSNASTSKDGHTVHYRQTHPTLCGPDHSSSAQHSESASCRRKVSPLCTSGEPRCNPQKSCRTTLRTSLLQHVNQVVGCNAFPQGALCTSVGVVCRRTLIDPNCLPVQHEFIGVMKANGSIDGFCSSLSRSLDTLLSDSNVTITLHRPDNVDICEQVVDAEFVLSASYMSANTKVTLPCNQVPELGKPDKRLAEQRSVTVSHRLGHVRTLLTHQNTAFGFVLSLDSIAQVKYDLTDTNVLWCEVPSSESNEGRAQPMCQRQPSLFPPMWRHDLAFWEDPKEIFDELKLHELIREITDDTIKNVILMNVWTDPSTGKVSRCYREIYQSSVRAVSHDLAHSLQNAVRLTVAREMNVELR